MGYPRAVFGRHLAVLLLSAAILAHAEAPGNLLRNPRFQDDWLTLLPENKNHHWCYADGFYHRRDFNPDGWSCQGVWRWLDADAPPGKRRLVLAGPNSVLAQRVNWVAVYDETRRTGFPDAGGFPTMHAVSSQRPLTLVRDLTFRLRLRGQGVPENAGILKLALCPPGANTGDPLGDFPQPLAADTAWLPAGTFDWQWAEVKLPAAVWLEAAKISARKKDVQGTDVELPLPATVSVSVTYKSHEGEIELGEAQLLAPELSSPNLLPNGGFETSAGSTGVPARDAWPLSWDRPAKYYYFPPGHYYIFNTWHNSNFPNRGLVRPDSLVAHGGARGLQMIVPPGDEVSVASAPLPLRQKDLRLLEVSAWVKTDRLCMLQIDALDEKGERLDGCFFIHKAPASIGTDDWRLIRQVFRPRRPPESVRLLLCARGVNGYTLDDTGQQPQNTVVGTVWWDDIRLCEPESTADELAARGVKPVPDAPAAQALHLEGLDLGECLLGDNELSATLVNPGPAGKLALQLDLVAPSGAKSQFRSPPQEAGPGKPALFRVPYALAECCPAYTAYRATLTVLPADGAETGNRKLETSQFWLATWTAPLDLELGALYLLPEQRQFVRLNFGFSQKTISSLACVRLEVLRRGARGVLRSWDLPATPQAIAAQRGGIPEALREDFTNLLLTDLDVSFLPLQPFNDPQRNWLIRATAIERGGQAVAAGVESQPFCRLDHDPPQPPIESVTVDNRNLLFVNGKPWMPWGVCYGFVPVYEGPAAVLPLPLKEGAGGGVLKCRDLCRLPQWSLYDGFNSQPYTRSRNDFNCLRFVAGSVTKPDHIVAVWQRENLYCSSAFVSPQPPWSVPDLTARAGGAATLTEYLAACKTSFAVVSTAPGIEEAFGLFHSKTDAELDGLRRTVEYIRAATRKPVMVGHGGYWNRFEFEKVPFFDLYDPETEPFYPANLHTDLWPLVKGQPKVIWLRPQMYEDVPYERWRFHVWVELMRGCRGWQIAHGPGDQSLFRGLHAEMEFIKPVVYSQDPGPKVSVEPWVEHWSRRHNGKTCILAATTHALTKGEWWWSDAASPAGRARVTESLAAVRTEVDGYAIGRQPDRGPAMHAIEYFPDARAWPAGSKLVQWVRLDPVSPPRNLVILARKDGRWLHAAAWGQFDVAPLRADPRQAYWFLRSFYRHHAGFLGWDDKLVSAALPYIPDRAVSMGALPPAGEWVKLELPLDAIAATGNTGVPARESPIPNLLDGVGFLHEGGRVFWARTSLVDPDGKEHVLCDGRIGLAPEQAAQVKISVEGLKAGARVRVLFEDREITAADGAFTDDFRGQDVYQRFGGGWGVGYGDAPVALHIYEVP